MYVREVKKTSDRTEDMLLQDDIYRMKILWYEVLKESDIRVKEDKAFCFVLIVLL